jgi:hypothetical protein
MRERKKAGGDSVWSRVNVRKGGYQGRGMYEVRSKTNETPLIKRQP